MKKYLKYKFGQYASTSPSDVEQESCGITNAIVEEPERAKPPAASVMVQPPLPPHPPPPDNPMQPTLKKEVEDDYYTISNNDHKRKDHQESSGQKADPGPEKEMCRQFVRGMCTRGDSCIYAHEIILSQLKDVYTFCNNFRNRHGCHLPNCKFVHATVFQSEHFYRTGVLPPNALAHISPSKPPKHHKGPGPSTSAQPESFRVVYNEPPPPIVFRNVPPPIAQDIGMGVPPPAVINICTNLPPRGMLPGHERVPPVQRTKMSDIVDFKLPAKEKCYNSLITVEKLKKKNADLEEKLKRVRFYANLIKGMQSGILTTSITPPIGGMNIRNETEINDQTSKRKLSQDLLMHLQNMKRSCNHLY